MGRHGIKYFGCPTRMTRRRLEELTANPRSAWWLREPGQKPHLLGRPRLTRPERASRHHCHGLILVSVLAAALYAALLGGGQALTSAGTLPAILPSNTGPAPPAALVTADTAALQPSTAPQPPTAPLSVAAPDVVRPTAVSALAASPTATPPPRLDRCEPAPSSSLYCVYTVAPGDTLSDIALEFGLRETEDGVSAAEMLAQSNKPDVINSDEIVPGQKLRIPVVSGIIHTVFGTQTLDAVAIGYSVTVESIASLPVNDVRSIFLVAGQELIVPDPKQLPVAALTSPPAPGPSQSLGTTPSPTPETPTPEATSEATATPTPEAAHEATATATPTETATPTATASATPTATEHPATETPTPSATPQQAPSSSGFIWPASGPISSYFGPYHPLGIDIDFYTDPNQAVRAAAAGTVTVAGGDACCSYGYYIIVDHGNGFSTLYAHLSQFASGIERGAEVDQGDVIGYGGHTGYATGNHLHFEVRWHDAVVNPLTYLP